MGIKADLLLCEDTSEKRSQLHKLTSIQASRKMISNIGSTMILLSLSLAALISSCIAIPTMMDTKTSIDIVKTFDTVQPQILGTTRHARDVHPTGLDVQITNSAGETFTLQLTLNNKLIAAGFASVYFSEDGKEIKVTDQINCFYHGKVLEYPEWKVAMDSCQGLRGSFGDWSNKTQRYNIEPLSKGSNSLEQPHALYQSDITEEDGECGTTHELDHDPLTLSKDDMDRAKRQITSGSYNIEVVIVSDGAQYNHYGSVTNTVNRAIAVANEADMIYSSENIHIVVAQSIVWTAGDRIQFELIPENTLVNFKTYRNSLQIQADAIVLLTGNDFSGNIVGIAYVNTMCSLASVAVVQDRHTSALATGSTFAHETGHLLGLDHDTSICTCNDPSGRCVMASVSGVQPPEEWSSCSVSQLQSALEGYPGTCLGNQPTTILSEPLCGNGIKEGDELCDCGSEQECDDPCCDASTCTLASTAQCSSGECCSDTCQFLTADTICRASAGECDIPETCTGQAAECPASDLFVRDGSTCNDDQAYCYLGECKTYDAQCQKHFGTNKGVDECFTSYNTEGQYYGNCGTDGTNYIPCSSSNTMCGQLFCQQGTFLNTVNSVYVVDIGVYVPSTRTVELCSTFTPPSTSDILSPGLVDDGIKCGNNKMCYEQRCVSLSSLGIAQCPTGTNGIVCSGNGVCNNLGQCSCDAGFSGTTCEPSQLCGGLLTSPSGSFQTPGWPVSYPSEDFECEWIVDVPINGYAIEFTIDSSAYGINGRPPCRYDNIKFFDGIDSNAASLHKLCKFKNPGPIKTSTSEAKVVFTGTSRSRNANRVGVRVTYTVEDIDECATGTHNCQHQCHNTAGSFTCSCNTGYSLDNDGHSCTADQPVVTSCGGQLTTASGSFQTPDWPTSYPLENFQCEWTITPPSSASRIYFYFDTSAFGINGEDPCTFDHIEFFDGTGISAHSLNKICGSRGSFVNLPTVLSTTSQVRVLFTGSDRSRPNDRVGVKVNYISF